jgi:Rieske Fe-S protein
MSIPHGTPPPGTPGGLSEQPRWRHDFPIDQPQDNYVARRDFTKFLVLISGAFVVGQVWIGVQNYFRRRRGKPEIRRIAARDEVPIGGAILFEYPTEHDPCLLIRLADNEFMAYSNQCTHLMCPVQPRVEEGRLHCPCHVGYFDLLTGRPTAGPPRRPLPRVTLAVRQGGIYATGIEMEAR